MFGIIGCILGLIGLEELNNFEIISQWQHDQLINMLSGKKSYKSQLRKKYRMVQINKKEVINGRK